MFVRGKWISKRALRDEAGEPGDGGNGGGGSGEGSQTDGNQGAGNGGNEGGGQGGSKPTETEAKLLKEVMQKKQALKELQDQLKKTEERFAGIDPDAVRTLLETQKQKEQEELEKRGEFERVKQSIIEQNKAEKAALQKQIDELKSGSSSTIDSLQRQLVELTVGRSFGDSSFVRDQLTLTPAKARVVYGAHFEVQDGAIVGFDKPVGAKDRTMLVDATGNPLKFDAALERLVQADPDRDQLIRSKMRNGANSKDSSAAGNGRTAQTVGAGRSRIMASIAANPDQLKAKVQ
jgi:hypothetical protein